MATKPSVDEIIRAVDALKEDSIAMLAEIVSHPSLLNNELSVQQFMLRKFKELEDPHLAVKQVPVKRMSELLSLKYVFTAFYGFKSRISILTGPRATL